MAAQDGKTDETDISGFERIFFLTSNLCPLRIVPLVPSFVSLVFK